MLREIFYDIEPPVDEGRRLDGHGDPTFQQTPAHGRKRAVDDLGETPLASGAVRGEKLQIADGKLVDPHVVVLVDAGNGTDVGYIAVLGKFEVMENGSGGGNTAGKVVDAEALERRGAELPAQLFAVYVLRKDPLVKPVGIEPRTESIGKTILVAALENYLLGREVGNELVDIRIRSLGHVELAGRNVEKSDTGLASTEIN